MDCVNIPENLQNFNEPPFIGAFQQLLANNVGKAVKIDFLIGSQGISSQSGVIEAVGLSYVLLKQFHRPTTVACDVYSIKFVTFLCERN